jgi:hypothetical protein
MKRRLLWTTSALLVLLVATWLLTQWVAKPFPVRAYERLRLGMTETEVNATIGMPPGYYDGIGPMPLSMSSIGEISQETGLPHRNLYLEHGGIRDDENMTVKTWICEDYWIHVAFDKNKMVSGFYLYKTFDEPRKRPTFIDRLRSLVGI